MKRGKLIVIDGPDYTGKKTQTDLLYERMKHEGLPVKTIRFPSYEKAAGRIIGQCLLGKIRHGYKGDLAWFGDPNKVDPRVASLLYAADRLNERDWMNEALDSGTNLITDRYYQANMGHQGAKINDDLERQRLFQYIESLEIGLNKIPREDLCIILTMPFEIAFQLSKSREEAADRMEWNWEHWKKASYTYEHMFEYFMRRGNWHRVESTWDGKLKSPEEIHEEIHGHVREELGI